MSIPSFQVDNCSVETSGWADERPSQQKEKKRETQGKTKRRSYENETQNESWVVPHRHTPFFVCFFQGSAILLFNHMQYRNCQSSKFIKLTMSNEHLFSLSTCYTRLGKTNIQTYRNGIQVDVILVENKIVNFLQAQVQQLPPCKLIHIWYMLYKNKHP